MSGNRGTIVLMGSGELTATMVEVHKALLRPYGASGQAVFLDTPAGFQLNVDLIARKAGDYFTQRVQKNLHVASFKSALENDALSAEKAYAALRAADYILIGPGSPTYALEQWRQSLIPKLLTEHIEKGGCLVAASAAALTMGRLTLPVYEIYKVGCPLHWTDGLDILGYFGLNLVVFPHWNNAEGGNHDTRYCFMGAQRLHLLEDIMPAGAQILGLDEHTALIIDFANQRASIQGVGGVTIRKAGREWTFRKGDQIPLAILQGEAPADAPVSRHGSDPAATSALNTIQSSRSTWETLHAKADTIRSALNDGHDQIVASGMLEMENFIWQVRAELEEQDGTGAAREIFRELLASLGSHFVDRPPNREICLKPVVDAFLALRLRLRTQKKWDQADAIRDVLEQTGIYVEDTPRGAEWHFRP
jgi:peptidase E